MQAEPVPPSSETQARPGLFRRISQQGSEGEPKEGGEGVDDTMRNLRKTFAGIFGDM